MEKNMSLGLQANFGILEMQASKVLSKVQALFGRERRMFLMGEKVL